MSKSEGKKKQKNFLPEKKENNKYLLSYPIYSISSRSFKELDNSELVLVAGGGGTSKTGVPNAFDLFKINNNSKDNTYDVEFILHQDTKDKIIYSSCIHPTLPIIVVSQANYCSFYQIIFDNNKISSLNEIYNFRTDFKGEDSVQNTCAFSPNGRLLVTAGEEGKLKIWNIDEDIIESSTNPSIKQEFNFNGDINSLHFSNDSNLIIYTTKNDCKIWEIENEKHIQSITPYKIPEKSSFRGCCFVKHSNSSFITVQGKPRFKSLLCEWNTDNGKFIKKVSPSFSGPQTAVNSRLCKDYQLVTIAYGEGDIEVYKVTPKGNIIKIFKQKEVHSFITTSISFSNDCRFVISGSVDRTFAVTKIKPSSGTFVEWFLFAILMYIIFMIAIFLWFVGFSPALDMLNNL